MISEGHHFVLQYRKGGYLCRRGVPATCERACTLVYWLTREPMEANRARNRGALMQLVAEYYWKPDDFLPVPAPVCGVCGSPELVRGRSGFLSPYRCAAHADRNPCVIEGCTRHTAADGQLANNQWFCAEHWRRYVPPRSMRRRAYLAFFRKAKRYGWTPQLLRQFTRFWDALVRSARRRSEAGQLDEAAINRLFGWEDQAGC